MVPPEEKPFAAAENPASGREEKAFGPALGLPCASVDTGMEMAYTRHNT